jgi:hypothetical protein
MDGDTSFEKLKNIESLLLAINLGIQNRISLDRLTYCKVEDGWTIQQVGTDYEYQKKVTLTGSAENIDVTIPFPMRADRMEYFSNDTTAKSFSVRIFDGAVDSNAYVQVANVVLDTNQSIRVDFGNNGLKFLHTPIIIRTVVSSSTAAKTLTIKIHIRKLDIVDLFVTEDVR